MNLISNLWSGNPLFSWAKTLFKLFKTIENSKVYNYSAQRPRIEPFIGSLDGYSHPQDDTGRIEPKIGSLSSFKQPPRARKYRRTELDSPDQSGRDTLFTQRQSFTHPTSGLFHSDEDLFSVKTMSSSFDHELDRMVSGYITNPATGLPMTSGHMVDIMGNPHGFSNY